MIKEIKESIEIIESEQNNSEEIKDEIGSSSPSNSVAMLDYTNYLDEKILDLKTYEIEEINNIDKTIDSDDYFNTNDIFDAKIATLNEKQLVNGTVVAVNDKEILIDIGFKSEGTISTSEFDVVPTVGEEIDVFLVVFEDRHGRLILSKERADFEMKWMKLRDAFKEETVINGIINKRIKGGMIVDLNGVNAFLPGSQLDVKPISDFDEFVNKEFEFKIVKFNEMRQNIVVSRKALLSESLDSDRKDILDKIDVGMELDGVVKNITDFGAFIDLGNSMDGLLHITDITWGRINNPTDKLSLGQSIKVKVIAIDEVRHRISLGTKQLSADPWIDIEKKFTKDLKVQGKVVNIMNYGIFIELEEGIEGLVHISEFSWTKHIKHPADLYKTGDKVDVIILSVDHENKKISLGIKQLSDNPWEHINDQYKVGDDFDGKVNVILSNGIYVGLDNEIEGFVNNEDISWTRKIKNPSNIYKEKDQVNVKILNIIEDEKKIILGIKQLTDDPWNSINDYFNEKDEVKGKILFIMDRGIIVLLENNFEGIIPASKIDKPKDEYKVDGTLSLVINEINETTRRLVLSIQTPLKDEESKKVSKDNIDNSTDETDNIEEISEEINENSTDETDNIEEISEEINENSTDATDNIDKNTGKSKDK